MRRALVILAACSHAPRIVHVPDQPPVLDRVAPALVYAPSEEVLVYRSDPGSPASNDVIARFEQAAGGHGIVTHDARLDRVAADLAPIAAAATPSPELVEFALRSHGVIEGAAVVAVARDPDALVAQVAEALRFSNVHVGIAGASPLVAVVVDAGPATFDEMPRWLPAHGEVQLHAALDPAFAAPLATITHDDGAVQHPHVAFDRQHHTFEVHVACGPRVGAQWIEIEAAHGHEVQQVALFPIWCAMVPPHAYAVEPAVNLDGVTTPDAIERRLMALINRERVAKQLAPLRVDPRAVAAAERYATLLRDHRRVAHDADGTWPLDRIRRAGVTPAEIFEGIADVGSLRRMAELLLNDPAYRDNALLPQVTHIGAAVAADAVHGDSYVTLLYERIVPPIDRAAAEAELAAALVTKDRVASPKLSSVAHAAAQGLADGVNAKDLWADLAVKLGELGVSGGALRKVVVTTYELDRVDPRTLVDRAIGVFGVGVGQAAGDGPNGGRLTIVVLLGS